MPKYIVVKDKIYQPAISLVGDQITQDMEAPLDNISIAVIGEDDPENIVLLSQKASINLFGTLSTSLYNIKYTIDITETETDQYTQLLLNELYRTPGIVVNDIITGNQIRLTATVDPAPTDGIPQISATSGDGLLVNVGTATTSARYMMAGFVSDQWLIDTSGNTLPKQFADFTTKINNTIATNQGLNITKTADVQSVNDLVKITTYKSDTALLQTRAVTVRPNDGFKSATVESRLDELRYDVTSNSTNFTQLQLSLNGPTPPFIKYDSSKSNVRSSADLVTPSELQALLDPINTTNSTQQTSINKSAQDIIDINAKILPWETTIPDHESRITKNSTDVSNVDTAVNTAKTDITNLKTSVTNIQQAMLGSAGSIITQFIEYASDKGTPVESGVTEWQATVDLNHLKYHNKCQVPGGPDVVTCPPCDLATDPNCINQPDYQPVFIFKDENTLDIKIRFILKGDTTNTRYNKIITINPGDAEPSMIQISDRDGSNADDSVIMTAQLTAESSTDKGGILTIKVVGVNGGTPPVFSVVDLSSITVNQIRQNIATASGNIAKANEMREANSKITTLEGNVNTNTTAITNLNSNKLDTSKYNSEKIAFATNAIQVGATGTTTLKDWTPATGSTPANFTLATNAELTAAIQNVQSSLPTVLTTLPAKPVANVAADGYSITMTTLGTYTTSSQTNGFIDYDSATNIATHRAKLAVETIDLHPSGTPGQGDDLLTELENKLGLRP